jgi:hypothetical protein
LPLSRNEAQTRRRQTQQYYVYDRLGGLVGSTTRIDEERNFVWGVHKVMLPSFCFVLFCFAQLDSDGELCFEELKRLVSQSRLIL